MKCENWTQEEIEMLKQSGICKHYGKYTGNCYRQNTDEDFPKCESKGKKSS